jgi:hypothetical protein
MTFFSSTTDSENVLKDAHRLFTGNPNNVDETLVKVILLPHKKVKNLFKKKTKLRFPINSFNLRNFDNNFIRVTINFNDNGNNLNPTIESDFSIYSYGFTLGISSNVRGNALIQTFIIWHSHISSLDYSNWTDDNGTQCSSKGVALIPCKDANNNFYLSMFVYDIKNEPVNSLNDIYIKKGPGGGGGGNNAGARFPS